MLFGWGQDGLVLEMVSTLDLFFNKLDLIGSFLQHMLDLISRIVLALDLLLLQPSGSIQVSESIVFDGIVLQCRIIQTTIRCGVATSHPHLRWPVSCRLCCILLVSVFVRFVGIVFF